VGLAVKELPRNKRITAFCDSGARMTDRRSPFAAVDDFIRREDKRGGSRRSVHRPHHSRPASAAGYAGRRPRRSGTPSRRLAGGSPSTRLAVTARLLLPQLQLGGAVAQPGASRATRRCGHPPFAVDPASTRRYEVIGLATRRCGPHKPDEPGRVDRQRIAA